MAASADTHCVLDGIHLAWQYCQTTKAAQDDLPIPFSALIELLHHVDNMPLLPYAPSFCGSCKSAMNCYCEVDFERGMWRCPVCGSVQSLPAHYRGITAENLPGELYSGCNVVEHELPPTSTPIKPPICIFVLDMCLSEEDMQSMKQAVDQALSTLPESTRVGIITFGSMVYLHNLATAAIATCTVYRGTAATTKRDIGSASRHCQTRSAAATAAGGGAAAGWTPFIVPLGDCDFAVDRVLEGMAPEPSKAGERHTRCTGAALGVAVSLLETAAYAEGGHVILLTGGPCTSGPGAIVGTDYAEPLRTHKDMDKGTTKHFAAAAAYYDGLAHRLIENGQALDVFACALDQTGVAEMEHVAVCTGGLITMAEHFGHDVFQNSFLSLLRPVPFAPTTQGASLEEALPWALNGVLEVSPGKNLGVSGAIGPVASLEKKTAAAVEPQIGLGATTAWKLNAMSPSTAVALFFRPTAKAKDKGPAAGSPLVFQVRLAYHHPTGARRMRVATKFSYWADPGTAPQSLSFNATTAAILFTRWIAYEASRGASARELSTWLDRQLVALAQKAAKFTEGDAGTVQLPPEVATITEMVFHIRRSQFLNFFGNAPDETVFYRSLLFREGREACALMIRPRFLAFRVDGTGAQDLPLDIASVPVDAVAVLDSWFTVIVHTGSHLASWIKQGLLEMAEYEHVREGYEEANNYAKELIASRNPQPRRVVCDQGDSQARFLLARLNPSQTQMNTDGQDIGAVIFTDDVSYDVFLLQLKKLIAGSTR